MNTLGEKPTQEATMADPFIQDDAFFVDPQAYAGAYGESIDDTLNIDSWQSGGDLALRHGSSQEGSPGFSCRKAGPKWTLLQRPV